MKARLEGGQLYTPAYVARVTAMVRGASRGIFVPSNLSALWAPLQQLVQEMNGASGVAVENAFFQSIFNRLLKEEEMLGSLRAGTHWTPTVCHRVLIFLECITNCDSIQRCRERALVHACCFHVFNYDSLDC